MNLDGKVALVLGAIKGIGKGIALALAQEGVKVAATYFDKQQWDLELETTLRAKQWVFEAALPYLKACGEGVVINFSSIAAIVGRSGPASLVFNEGYSAASRGISLLTETWARLGAPEVRVNEIMLGFIETRHAEKTRGWGLLTAAQSFQDTCMHRA